MDFTSLQAGQPVYILQKSEKPVLQVGVVKSKGDPKSHYQTNTPNILNGLAAMQGQNLVVDIVATVNGADVPFSNLPVNAETSSYNNGQTFISCSREAMLQAVDAMIQSSKKALEQVDYHKVVLTEGERMLETLNPTYAADKERDRTIRELVDHRKETDSKLDQILAFMQDLTSPAKKQNP